MRELRSPLITSRRDVLISVLGVLGLAGLAVVSHYNYLLFHVLAETFSIAVAFGMFLVAWNTWDLTSNGYLQFLGVAFLFIGGLDLVHTLAYKGMGIFPGYDVNLSTQLWVVARGLQSLALLVAPNFHKRKVDRHVLLGVWSFLFVVFLVLIFTCVFPDCYIEGQGLTPFKIVSEYVISVLLGLAILRLFQYREAFGPEVTRCIVAAIACSVVSELLFTLYVGVYEIPLVVGHLFKIVAFYFIYRAVVETGLRRPYEFLFREVQQRNTQLAQEVSERRQTEQDLAAQTRALKASEARVRTKLESIMEPDGDLGVLHLTDIMDVDTVQALMDDFYSLTNIGIAILDIQGEVLVATGWQDICTKFHRVHPQTSQYCLESDTALSSGVCPGTYKLYKCKNHMWDMVTPIVVGGQHIGNLFLGQFFFDDEEVDPEVFRRQAQTYGFDEAAYLAALDRVPRWSREKVATIFGFYTKFATLISRQGHSNLLLARSLAEQERLLVAHRASEQKFRSYIENAPYGIFVCDEEGRYIEVNAAACRSTGYTREELLNMQIVQLASPSQVDVARKHFGRVVEQGFSAGEVPFVRKDGSQRLWSVIALRLSETRFLGYTEDITDRKQAELDLRLYAERLLIQHEIDIAILAAQSSQDIARAALLRLRELVPFDLASICEIDQARQRARDLVILSSEGMTSEISTWYPLSYAGHMLEAFQRGEVYEVQDIHALETLSDLERVMSHYALQSYVSVPLMVQNVALGTLTLAADTPDFFNAGHIEILKGVAASLSVALHESRLLDQTQRDAETKALLLREVNHRVLNNLTMILSILDMEQRRALDSRADFHAALQDVHSRIEGMTTVHRMLSDAEWAPLDLGAVVSEVISAALSGSPIRHAIQVVVDRPPDPLRLMSKQAIAVALVINELTTNSVKYAFQGRSEGRIEVHITALAAEGPVRRVRLVFRDDGPGWPEAVLADAYRNVGLWLVERNVQYTLNGEIELQNDHGAVATMTFALMPVRV